ncbi:GntR family transcriptional regulator [Plantactinospora sp. B5E13]|uniref:GntR family transcriptional regulator n=1 Tax=unclassified Plantactinospora TaxID=2631981 RepID=UPI00325DD643
MIRFQLDRRSGVSPYLQLVHQVRQAIRLGHLRPGDQLPTAREVVEQVAINPNTVHKAYRELERDGLVAARPGVGTFVQASLSARRPAEDPALRVQLADWVAAARRAGLDEDDVRAVFDTVVRHAFAGTSVDRSGGVA